VLGGVLSALDGVTPESLRIPELAERARAAEVAEVILAVGATIDGQTTAHVIADHLEGMGVEVTTLAKGVPVGGELDYLDDGTISAALAARKAL
jgi:recombination protein RecR